MTNGLIIRAVAPTDFDQWLPLWDGYNSEQALGQGIGRALINGVYDRAREAGSPRVYWQTQDTNVVAQKLYDKVAVRSGFIVYRKTIDAQSDPYFAPVA